MADPIPDDGENSVAEETLSLISSRNPVPVQPKEMTIDDEVKTLTTMFNDSLARISTERKALQQQRDAQQSILDRERAQLREELAAEWAQVRAEKGRLEEMSGRAQAVMQDQSRVIRVSVGGEVFETTIGTITAEPNSMLSALFSGNFTVETTPDGTCFIDRDPSCFRIILSHLRNLKFGGADADSLKKLSDEKKLALTCEAQFYGLDKLLQILQPGTFTVSPDMSSDFRRISEALQEARDGDTILVKPGTYFDSISLIRSVNIIGDGPKGSVIIRSPVATCADCRCESGSLRNLIFESSAAPWRNGSCTMQGGVSPVSQSPNGAFGDFYCVFISEGNVVIEDCEIRYGGLSCIKIMAGSKPTNPTLRGNDIYGAQQCGVLVTNGAQALIVGNDIHHNRFSGVEIRSGAKPTLQDNRIHDNLQNGVYVHSDGEGVVDNNHLHSNNFNGINVEGPVVVSRNRIHSNNKRGIFYGASTVLTANDVCGNAVGDVALKR